MEDLEDYGFEYSDEDSLEDDADIENQYYSAKGTHEQFCLMSSELSSVQSWITRSLFLQLADMPTTVQDCWRMAQHAMPCMDLPLFWTWSRIEVSGVSNP